jgi:hypothetical protein
MIRSLAVQDIGYDASYGGLMRKVLTLFCQYLIMSELKWGGLVSLHLAVNLVGVYFVYSVDSPGGPRLTALFACCG